jgi:hypothetical protein
MDYGQKIIGVEMKSLEEIPAQPTARDPHLSAWIEHWKNPTAAFQGKPFWCWNGKLTEEELLRQLPIFKEMGMGGVFMHSRTGLATEYLGDEWFHLVNTCADEAEKLGMEAWLYDEDRWPSGSAGGLATREDRFRMRYLRLKIWPKNTDWTSLEWPDAGAFIAAFSADVDGLDLEDYSPLAHGKTPVDGLSLLIFTWELMDPHSFYNGGSYLDTMNPEATEHFLAITHDRYAEKCGQRIGSSIRGIFTDEPHHGFVMCDHHGQPGPSDTAWLTPWTPLLPEEFQKAFGHDLLAVLPELYLQKDGVQISRVKWEYMELIQRLFLENWARPMQERCHKLGMTLTGHVLHEDSLGAQAVPCGSMMRYYEFLDYPGVDVLGLDNRNYWIVKQLTSVGRQMGKPWLISELYGCSGWQMGLDGHKRIGDWQALYGINIRCHHLSWYSMAGESKRDYPASIFFQSSWYREYAQVENYFSRLHVLLQTGSACCDVLVINPVESVWAGISAGWATWLQSADPEMSGLEKSYRDLFTWLTTAQIDFDYGDEDHLARLGSVEGTFLRLGEMRYLTVIVSGMRTVRDSTLELLRSFRAAGGNVIFIGEPPAYVDARPSNDAIGFASAGLGPVAANAGAAIAAVRDCGGAAADWECDALGLLCQVRQVEDGRIAVVINPDEHLAYEKVRFRARITGAVTELDCLRGDVFSVPSEVCDGWLIWKSVLGPLQERVFFIGDAANDAPPRPIVAFSDRTALPGPFDYELDEPNLCVLDFADWQVDGGAWQPETEILKIEEAIAAGYGVPLRSGQMVQPWAAKAAKEGPSRRVGLRFRFEVGNLLSCGIELLLEQPSNYRITLNGIDVEVPSLTEWFIDPCFRRVPLPTAALNVEGNEILLECDYRQGHDLEAIYLAGAFGVQLTGRKARLIPLPAQLKIGDICGQGLPFYSGKVRYKLPAASGGRLVLSHVAAACVNFVLPDGDGRHEVPWPPFECSLESIPDEGIIAELCLTRRNTFGPLHLVPIEQSWIGPETFRSSGENWSDDYQLIPAGILAVPELLR